MSTRAAARLEVMGFDPVYDYANGKSDWFAAGLERAGTNASVPRIGDFAEDAVTCLPGETVGVVRERLRAARSKTCVVVNEAGVVLGVIRGASLSKADEQATAAAVAHPGPKTYRADYTLDDPLEWMEANHVGDTIITSPDGRLLGITPLEPVRRFIDEFRKQTAGRGPK